MKPEDNVNHQPTDQGEENPNPPQPPNLNTQTNDGLDTLRKLVNQLRNMREPSRESLSISLDVIARSITSAQGKLTSIFEYREIMFEYYNAGFDGKKVGYLGISKQEIMSIFINPRSQQQPPMTKKCICIDWCIHPKINKNWMDRWYMVFDKPPCNNREVPLYCFSKIVG